MPKDYDKTIPQGVVTTVFACVAPHIGMEGMRGAYLSDCDAVLPNEMAQDVKKELRQAFWKVTQEQLEEATKKVGLN